MKVALPAALSTVLAFAGVAQAQDFGEFDGHYTPESEYTTIDSVGVDVIQRPRSFVGLAKTNRPSTNRLSYVITALCRAVPQAETPDLSAFAVTVTEPLYYPYDITFCGGGKSYDEYRPIGTTWYESKRVTSVLRVSKSMPLHEDLSTEVSWGDHQVGFLSVDATRVKRVYKWKIKKTPHRYSYVVRMYADKNFDRYWNYCVVRNLRVYSSGGRFYCRVRYTYRWTERQRLWVFDHTRVKWSVSGMSDFDGAALAAADLGPAP